MAYKLKKISEKDRTAVIDIFNYFIKNSFAAYPESEVQYQKFDRFLDITAGYPAITVRDESNQVVGFAFLHPYHSDDSLSHTAEICYFILPEHTRKGLGVLILEYFISEAKKMGISIFLASISSLNDQSIQFHLKQGFIECGRFKGIGRKHGQTFDVVWMQKNL
jgi:L-amino acid N-acyltransferase YncA